MKSLLLSAFLVPVVALAQGAPSDATAEVERGVKAYNAGDIKYYEATLLDGVVYVADDGATFEGKPRVLELFTRILASQPAPSSRSRTQSPRPRATSPGCDSTGRGQGGRTAVRAWRPQSSLGWAVRGRWRRSKTPPAGTPPTDVARLVRSRHLILPRCGRRHSKFLREGKLSTPTERERANVWAGVDSPRLGIGERE